MRRIRLKLLVAFATHDDLYIASEYMFWGPAPLEVAYKKGVCTLAICITAELYQNIYSSLNWNLDYEVLTVKTPKIVRKSAESIKI